MRLDNGSFGAHYYTHVVGSPVLAHIYFPS